FVPDGLNASAGTLTYRAWDQMTGSAGGTANVTTIGTGGTTAFSLVQNTVSVAATAVNDAPGLSGSLTLASVNEDATNPPGASITQLLSSSGVTLQDPDTGASLGGLAIVSNPADPATVGAWQYSTDGTNWYAIGAVSGESGAVALSASTQLRFVPVADYNGTPPALTVRAMDNSYSSGYTAGASRTIVNASINGGITAIAGATVTIGTGILSVNDAPALTSSAPASVSVAEDSNNTTAVSLGLGSVTYGKGGGADESGQTLTYTITAIPSFVTLYKADGTTPVLANATLTATELQGLKYKTVGDANGTGNITWTVTDNGQTNGVNDFKTLNQSLTVTVNAVDDIAGDSVNTNEDTALTFAASSLLGNDTFGPGATVTAVGGASHGTVSLSGGNITYTPTGDYSGSDSFTYTVTSGGVTETATVSVTVTSVNDAPTGTDKTITTNEDTGYTFAASDFGFGDGKDSPANTLTAVKITTVPGAGTLKLSGATVNAGDVISAANLGNLVFTPGTDANGAGYASFTFQVQDSGGTANGGVDLDQSANTITVNVTPVTDPSTVTLSTSGPASVVEGSTITYTATVDNAVTGTDLVLT
ncbi:unnamed protein product, partial [Phaeothamnion confervicola]